MTSYITDLFGWRDVYSGHYMPDISLSLREPEGTLWPTRIAGKDKQKNYAHDSLPGGSQGSH
jgi:hypothetical protein